MPDILLTKTSSVIVNLSTLAIVVGFAITSSFALSKWKTLSEEKDKDLDAKIILMSQYLERVELESKDRDKDISEEVNLSSKIVNQNQIVLAEIQTDLKWLIKNSGGGD